jgi:hypothetical protein
MKLNFPGPEVWQAEDDDDDIESRRDAFRRAGVNVTVTSGLMIASLAERLELRGFAFRDDVLELDVDREDPVRVPYDWSVQAITCQPLDQEPLERMTVRQSARAGSREQSHRQSARKSLAAIKAPVDKAFVDLYFTDGTQIVRATMWPGRCEFSGLEDRKQLAQRQNIREFIQVLCDRFESGFDDRRLENAPEPKITMVGRRTLRGHLELVDPSMKDIDEHDLLSRLAFLGQNATE